MKKAILGIVLVAGVAIVAGSGCGDNRESKKASTTQPISRYKAVGARQVPDYLKGTIYEKANMWELQPFLVNSYGLVGGLRQTGDNSAVATTVRNYIRNEIMRHRMSSTAHPSEEVLNDKTFAIVRVDALIPPGARQNDRIDVLVSVPEESNSSSLSHGVLYQTPLKYMGAVPQSPGGLVNSMVTAQGPVFVNPDYALVSQKKMDAMARQSLRYGVVMGGGVVLHDQALVLQLRDPSYPAARGVEQRINQRLQAVADKANQKGVKAMAQAEDDAVVQVFMPGFYHGDYEHFAGVIKHLYLDSSPGYLASMAEKLAEAADRPNAPLENISYALEGIGEPARGVLEQMMKSPKPEVAFAAARAAAFFAPDGDTDGARAALLAMARDKKHPFRLNAVKTLADMNRSAESDPYLRQLLNVEDAPVRIEAYKALVQGSDPRVVTQVVRDKFALDLIPSSATPMIYCTRRGVPRIALFGTHQALQTPVTFTAMDTRLTFTSDIAGGAVTLFYRSDQTMGDTVTMPIKQTSQPDLVDIIQRLAGEAKESEQRLDFSYADVVSLLQSMQRAGKLTAQMMDGTVVPVVLIIEEQTGVSADAVNNAPQIPEASRQQHDDQDSMAPPIPDRDQPTTKPDAGAKKSPAGNSRPN